jgi:hypothetical protein
MSAPKHPAIVRLAAILTLWAGEPSLFVVEAAVAAPAQPEPLGGKYPAPRVRIGGGWVLRMAEVLTASGYHVQFFCTPQSSHMDLPVHSQNLAPALEWLWHDYKPSGK